MNIFVILSIAFGLSADAFTVAITRSAVSKEMPLKYGLQMAAFFGFFQFLMPILGWAAGIKFIHYITAIDHWIAFALLAYVGGKMVWEGQPFFKQNQEYIDTETHDYKQLSTLVLLSIATSIDALAIGLTFAMIKTAILFPSIVIGITAFIISLFGFLLGKKLGAKLKIKPDFFGGLILIGIGIKILIEHLQ